MDTYKIPLTFKTGKFRFSELNASEEDKVLNLTYKARHQLLTYNVPIYNNEVRLYFVPQNLMPDGLCAVYGDSGELDRVELAAAGDTRLVYRRFQDISSVKESILKYAYEQADKMCAEITSKKQPLARLFLGTFYDGEALEIGVKTATAEELKAISDKYSQDLGAADDCDKYPKESLMLITYIARGSDGEDMMLLDGEPLGIMILCTDIYFQGMLFDMAVSAIRERILSKIDKTDDFKVILEVGD